MKLTTKQGLTVKEENDGSITVSKQTKNEQLHDIFQAWVNIFSPK